MVVVIVIVILLCPHAFCQKRFETIKHSLTRKSNNYNIQRVIDHVIVFVVDKANTTAVEQLFTVGFTFF